MEKPIPGFPGYSVDDHGNVYSRKRGYKTKMSLNTHEKGYLDVRLWDGRKHKVFRVHRLVAEAFCPGRSDLRNEVNHKDNNRKNNRASNLEWVDHQENMRHRTATGWVAPVGEERKSNKKIVAISLSTGERTVFHSASVAEKSGFSKASIYSCLKGRTKTHNGHRFELSSDDLAAA